MANLPDYSKYNWMLGQEQPSIPMRNTPQNEQAYMNLLNMTARNSEKQAQNEFNPWLNYDFTGQYSGVPGQTMMPIPYRSDIPNKVTPFKYYGGYDQEPQGLLQTSMEENADPKMEQMLRQKLGMGVGVKSKSTPQMDELDKKQLDSLALQKQGLEDMRKAIKGFEGKKLKTDISPLLSLSDAITGTNFMQGYERPMNADQKEQIVMKLKDELQRRTEGLTKEEIALLKAQKEKPLEEENIKSMMDLRKAQTYALYNKPQKGADDINLSLKIGKEIRTSQQGQMLQQADNMNSALNNYLDQVKKANKYSIFGQESGPLSAAREDLALIRKEMYKLGSLQRSEELLVKSGLPTLTEITSLPMYQIRGGMKGVEATINKMKEINETTAKSHLDTLNQFYGKYPQAKENLDYYKNIINKMSTKGTTSSTEEVPQDEKLQQIYNEFKNRKK